MPLFEPSAAPLGERPKRYGESLYAYYRDSERVGIVVIRALLEGWFVKLPEDERLDLQQRSGHPSNGNTVPLSLSYSSITCLFGAGSKSNFIQTFQESLHIPIFW